MPGTTSPADSHASKEKLGPIDPVEIAAQGKSENTDPDDEVGLCLSEVAVQLSSGVNGPLPEANPDSRVNGRLLVTLGMLRVRIPD